MRTKEKIIDAYEDDMTHHKNKEGCLFLEVLIDIRDILAKTSTSTVNLKMDSTPLSIIDIIKGYKKGDK